MSEIYGWTGKILRVNLSSGETLTIDTMKYVPHFIGGVGIASRIAWEELSPGVDAFGPENPLFIMVGPLTGTLASGSGRVEVLGIAPQQHPPVFSRSGMGGHWGAELKYAGYDGVIIHGKSEKPVYIWIDDGQVSILDASNLWGRGTYGTTMALRALHGKRTRVISCGQAGEHLSRIAIIQTETGNAAGQGGYGAVMGSKNLKAIAVRGTKGVKIAKPKEFFHLCMHASREGQGPGSFEIGTDRRGVQTDKAGNTFRLRKCGFCSTPCSNPIYENVQSTDGLTVPSVVQQCWGYMGTSQSVDRVARAMTSDYGLNGWEITYGIIPWLQLCKQHGLIDKIDDADTTLMSKLFSASTGYDLSEKELDRAGERIWNLLRAIDVRNFERNRAIDESTIDGFMYPGKDDGVILDREKFLKLLDRYYELSGWTISNGWPTRARLEELGLGDVADGLERVGKPG